MGAVTGGLLGELAAVGFPVDSVWDLRRSGAPYRAAVPVLVTWLPRVCCRDVVEDRFLWDPGPGDQSRG
jgi:hypothetical protein